MKLLSVHSSSYSLFQRWYWHIRRGQLTKDIGNQVALQISWLRARFSRKLTPVKFSSDLGERAYQHVRAVVEMGERYPNSHGWQQQIEYIRECLKSINLQPETDRWLDSREGLNFENVSATIPGRSNRRIIIAAHHDTKKFVGHPDSSQNFHFVGANDGGSGVGLLLALAEELRHCDNYATLQFVFFDGEESITVNWANAERALFGSRRFVDRESAKLKNNLADTIAAVIVLDMVGCKDLQIDDDAYSDDKLKTIFRRAVLDLGYSKHFFRQRIPIEDDHLPFIEFGIPTIDLIQKSRNPYWHTPDDTLANVCKHSLQMVAEVVLTSLPSVIDRLLSNQVK